jgi:hypothetical protein
MSLVLDYRTTGLFFVRCLSVLPIIYTTYAVVDPTGDFAPFDDAQGRLRQGGRNYLFSEKRPKCTMLPQAILLFTG